MSATPKKSQPPTPRPTPRQEGTTDISQGSKEVYQFLTSKKGIVLLVATTIFCVIASLLINKYLGNKWVSVFLGFILCLGFFVRHIIGNKIDRKQD